MMRDMQQAARISDDTMGNLIRNVKGQQRCAQVQKLGVLKNAPAGRLDAKGVRAVFAAGWGRFVCFSIKYGKSK
ncbi:hypothetical protein [Siminovitchia sp. 179-K 8D1 HS]|uniref:hypothetical protein n=1 Tax=Siminovitchia sp. 179-K 8D1 HS TaxID=3142385 RepID=UPI0039A06B6E